MVRKVSCGILGLEGQAVLKSLWLASRLLNLNGIHDIIDDPAIKVFHQEVSAYS